ncbi:MAG: thioredoxin [Methanomicrobiales archaeon]|nr:thioredoxin [Methanomicrobiales archaeon]
MTIDLFRETSDKTWETDVERSEKPVFVMFYSPSCIHCTRILHHIEELAQDFGTEVSFFRINQGQI